MAAHNLSQQELKAVGIDNPAGLLGLGQQVGRSLAFLRLFNVVAMLAVLFLAQHDKPTQPRYAWDAPGGLLLLAYAAGAVLLIAAYRLLPYRRFTPFSLLFDVVMITAASLTSGGLLVPFGILPLLAVAMGSSLWLGAISVLLYAAANASVFYDVMRGLIVLPFLPFVSSVFFAILLTVTYAVTLNRSRAAASGVGGEDVNINTLRQSLLTAYRVSNALSANLTSDTVLSSLFSELGRVLPHTVGLALLNDNDEQLVVKAATGVNDEEQKRVMSEGGNGVLARVLRTGQSVIVRSNLARQDAALVKVWTRLAKCESALIVPLRATFEVYGVLIVASPHANLYNQEQMVLLEALANNATVALKNSQLYEALREERDRVIQAEAQTREERDRAVRAEAEARAERDRVLRAEAEVREERDRAVRAEALAHEERDRAMKAETEVREERDRVIRIQEETRKSLARDLHDGPAQTLAAITMNLEVLKKMLEVQPDPARVFSELDNLTRLARTANHTVRTTLFELRPLVLETKGLVAALEQYQQRFLPSEGMLMHIDASHYLTRQGQRTEATIFDIIQEAVGNAKKHAKAHNVLVTLGQVGNWIVAVVQDDGAGFDLDAVVNNYERRGSFGLLNMRERAQTLGGDLRLESAPDKGTKVTVQIPVSTSGKLRS